MHLLHGSHAGTTTYRKKQDALRPVHVGSGTLFRKGLKSLCLPGFP